MKNFCLILSLIALSIAPAIADTMAVQAMTDISTELHQTSDIKFKVLRDCKLGNIELRIGDTLEGDITITDPKRLKRSATFFFTPKQYTNTDGKTNFIEESYNGKFTPDFELDKKKLAESAAVSVADHFLKGVGMGFYALKGAIQNQKGNVLVSTASSVYEHSFLSYCSKGKHLVIAKGSLFGLKFSECVNEPIEE